jgi:hypothetical protein
MTYNVARFAVPDEALAKLGAVQLSAIRTT